MRHLDPLEPLPIQKKKKNLLASSLPVEIGHTRIPQDSATLSTRQSAGRGYIQTNNNEAANNRVRSWPCACGTFSLRRA
jgi:hypothetical protein